MSEKHRVLLVDNELAFLEVMSDILGFRGFTCLIATSIEDAKTCFCLGGDIDLLITDLRVSNDDDPNDTSAEELIAWVGENCKATRIVLLSGYYTAWIVRRLLQTKLVDDVIGKEEGPDALLATIRSVLGIK